MGKDYGAVIERRIAFLLQEARSPDHENDHVVGYALRVLSNHFTIGRSGNSGTIKLLNRRMSSDAQRFLLTCRDARQWCAGTTNEHPDPLSQVWKWIVGEAHSLTTADIAKRLGAYPMVTVTKREDKRLREKGFGSAGPPKLRYESAGIDIVLHDEEPRRVLRASVDLARPTEVGSFGLDKGLPTQEN